MAIPRLSLSVRVAHFLGVALPEGTDFEVVVEAWGVVTTTLLYKNFGHWQSKGMRMPSTTWGLCMAKVWVCRWITSWPICGQICQGPKAKRRRQSCGTF